MTKAVADPRGRPWCDPLPTAKNFLDFMQFLGKFDKIVCWPPPPEGRRPLLQGILDPPLDSFHINYCNYVFLIRPTDQQLERQTDRQTDRHIHTHTHPLRKWYLYGLCFSYDRAWWFEQNKRFFWHWILHRCHHPPARKTSQERRQ